MDFDRHDGVAMSRRRLLGSLGGIVAIGATARTTAGQRSDEQNEQWPQIQYGPDHTGSAAAVTPPGGELQTEWRSDPGGELSAPVVAEGLVFAAADGVYAFDTETGLGEWHFEESVSTGVTYHDGFVYAGSGGTLYAIDAGTGEEVWSHEFPDDRNGHASTPTVADGGLFVCWSGDDHGSSCYRLEPRSGDVVWQNESGDPSATPMVADGLVVTGSHEGCWAYDSESGEQQWEVDHDVRAAPTYADGLVVIRNLDEIVAIDPSIGSVRWERDDFGGRVYSDPAYVDGTLYAGSNELHAIDSTTGETQWTADVANLNGGLGVTEEWIYVCGFYGYFSVVDRSDRSVIHQFSLDRRPTQPAMAGETLYICTLNGLHALVEQNTTPEAEFEYAPVRPTPGEEVSFDGSLSSDPDGSVASYAWTIDGETVTGTNVTHAFSAAGEYEVELSVTDDEGATATDTTTVTVAASENDGPDQAFTYSPARPVVGEPVSFEATRSGESYSWDLDDDGEFEIENRQASHAFTRPGEHTVTLRLDREDTTVTVDRTVAVRADAPVEVSFVSDGTSVRAGETATLAAVVTNFDDSRPVIVDIELQDVRQAAIENVSNAEVDARTLTVALDAAEQRTVRVAFALDDPGMQTVSAVASYEYTGGAGGEVGQVEPATIEVRSSETAAVTTDRPASEQTATQLDRDESTTHTVHGDGPGMGVVTALGGLSLGALRYVRRGREE